MASRDLVRGLNFVEQCQRATGVVELRAVDGLDDVTVLEAHALEQGAGPDVEDTESYALPVLEVRYGAHLRDDLAQILDRVVDFVAVYDVAIVAHRADPGARSTGGGGS